MILILTVALIIFAIGLAGIATQKHFIVVLLAVELMLLASTILFVRFFSYATGLHHCA